MGKDREEEKRDAPNVSETEKKDGFSTFFSQLRALLQTHGYPVKEDRAKKLQSTSALSQNKDKVSPSTSREISNWIPSFHSYEDFNHMAIQSLGGFMIILSTDGVIRYVAENISSVLGYVPNEIVGKTLLSLLPDQEKREVFQKICLKLPLSNSVGNHIEFCCHLKRGNIEHDKNPPYEYAKFILTVHDISDEPLVLLRSFLPSQQYIESSDTQLPLEDQFYVVGTVCIFRARTLWELLTVKETIDDIEIVELSDEENSSMLTSDLGQRINSEMESLPGGSTASASYDQADIIEVEKYESEVSAHIITVESDISRDSSTSSMEVTPLPAVSSLKKLEFKHMVEYVDDVVEVEQLEQIDQMEEVVEVEQENLSSFSVAAGISAQSLRLLSPVAAYINKREKELMKLFKKQLEEKTKILQADIRNQKDAMEMMKEQLNTLKDSKFKMQLTTDTCDPQSLEPCPKKQRTEQMEKSLIDPNETKCFDALCFSHSLKFPEELQVPCDTFNQAQSTDVHLQLFKNLGGQEDESQSFSQSPTTYDSDSITREIPQDYIQLGQQSSDPQNHLNIQVKVWPHGKQDDQATLPRH
ncbi:circadian clock protein PASD1 isoform X1 [Phyllostomus discolor]|uniref:Circadian clock protein PASD1 isoform X1 n=1 Tax=Phyllostomus discolor TaxID=89673 RepID=A0A7E6D0W9_9CHIR|nr:circadian clock protein PASD1 isoform X1 [Phyllostomus discolor]